jgi:hypothetical protein
MKAAFRHYLNKKQGEEIWSFNSGADENSRIIKEDTV